MPGNHKPPRGIVQTPDPKAIGGSRQLSTDAHDAKSYLWAGTIIHVDVETMVCSIRIDSGQGERHDIPLPAPGGGGPRSWSGVVPEPGTKVILGWKKFGNRQFVPYIIQFLTNGVYPGREFEPFSSIDPVEASQALDEIPELADDPRLNLGIKRLRLRKAYPGDYLASSSGGADILLDRDLLITNRAGNEFRLRDADQTAILQTLNEFTSNSAGYYRRGLIKRNAFNFLPDLYPLDDSGKPATIIPTTHVAYDILLAFGLIKPDGTKNFVDDPDSPFYPFIVSPDGQRSSYVVHGEHDNSFADTKYAYIEDRVELRHFSDGVMAVTEEGDGFQIDPPYPVYIEDVKGTVVGNDFHSDAGRPQYKRVLGMRLFSNPEQGTPSDGPIFEPIDTVQRLDLMDDLALARLFRVQSPNSSNQYCFGITKEGKVLLHIPKTRVGEAYEKGKSADINIAGLVKAIIGADENNNNTSIDIRTQGGINLDIGRFKDGSSIHLNLHGKIRKVHNGNDDNGLTNEEVYGGSTMKTVSGSDLIVIGGSSVEDIGGEKALRATSISINSGAGGLKQVVGGDLGTTVLGKSQEQYAQLVTTTYAIGRSAKFVLGVDSKTVIAGGITNTVMAGSGISDNVIAGNILGTIGTGNYGVTVGAGNFSATVGAGNLSMTVGAGSASFTSSLVTTITGGVSTSVIAPIINIGAAPVGCIVAGVPGPPGPHVDYITGVPILGVPARFIGL